MTPRQLIDLLLTHRESALRFQLPSGDSVPAHFHITEVGHVEKKFIDCGGMRRLSVACVLQIWTANDVEHRMTAVKLANILKLAEPVFDFSDLPIEIEYGCQAAAYYTLSKVEVNPNELCLILVGKPTDCLARDKCGVGECSTSGCCE